MDVEASEQTRRAVWIAVAQAAAEHRRLLGENRVFFHDITLGPTGGENVWQRQSRAITEGLQAGVGDDELLDALITGDPQLGLEGAKELIEFERHWDTRMADLDARVMRDLFGEPD
jgi:hypothetical protein